MPFQVLSNMSQCATAHAVNSHGAEKAVSLLQRARYGQAITTAHVALHGGTAAGSLCLSLTVT